MNLKQLSILIVLVLVMGGAGLYLSHRKEASLEGAARPRGQKLLAGFPLNDIAQIDVKQGKAEADLVKQEEEWKVKERANYPANFSQIKEFLQKIWELKGIQEVPAGKSQLGRLELEPGQGTNAGTVVEFKDKGGKLIRSLVLGKKHQRQSEAASPFGGDMGGWPDGRFILVSDNPKPEVWIVAEPFQNIEPKPESWLNKDFFKVEKLRSVSVTSTHATNAWKLARETEGGEMKLQDRKAGEELDSAKSSGVNYLLTSPTFTDVLSPDAKPEAVGLDKPVVAVLDTFDNFHYTVELGRQTNEDIPLRVKVSADLPKERVAGKEEKPDEKTKLDKEFKEKQDKLKEKLNQEKAYGKWTYLVSKWTVDALLKPRSELLAPPKEPKKEEANKAGTNAPVVLPPVLPPAPKAGLGKPVLTPPGTAKPGSPVPAASVPKVQAPTPNAAKSPANASTNAPPSAPPPKPAGLKTEVK